MPPSRSLDFRPTEIKEKKIALLAVISFNDANKVSYSRGDLYKHFDINERTARNWVVAHSGASASQPAQPPSDGPKITGSQGIKRSHSEDVIAELLSSTVKSGPAKSAAGSRQNTGGNSAQGQKKRKIKQAVMTPSPDPPNQLPTPPRPVASQPKKRRQRESTESSIGYRMDDSDEV